MKGLEKNVFRANRIFVDRIEPTALVNDTCKRILNKEFSKKIFVFYGYGGIGKSKFFEEIQRKLECKEDFNIVRINLNVYEYNNVISILLAIRRSLDVDCKEFDYATMQYYNKCQLPFSQLKEQLNTAKSTIFSMLKESLKNCADVVVPGFSYFEKIAGLFPKAKEFISLKKKEKIYSYIEQLDSIELHKQLPILLAKAISDSGKKNLFIFDDFESMQNKLEGCSLSSAYDEWIVNFVKNINCGLFLFSSREKLSWSESKFADTSIEQYYLERLTEKDSRLFLQSVPIVEEECISDILNVAQGIPIYLDMCVDLYENYKKDISVGFDLKNVDTESIINRYLAHLTKAQEELVHILAHLEVFDFDFLDYVVREINLSIDKLELKQLLEKCIFNYLGEGDYKLDASIQKQLKLLQDKNVKDSCFLLLLKYISKNNSVCLNNLLSYFESMCKLINEYRLLDTKSEQERFFVCINKVLDAGYWTSLEALVSKYLTAEEYEPYLLYVRAHKEKREGKLNNALILTDKLLENSKVLGNYRFAPHLLKTQIIHLLGNYDEAIKCYESVIEKMELFDLEEKDEKTYVLAQLKLADVNFLKGKFISAKKSLKTIKFSEDTNLEIESLRIKAHIHRFNLDYENAKELYEQGLENSKNDPKAYGMLLNNVTEIYCIKEPKLAIEYGHLALEKNRVLNANIEVGKTYSALSIAYARIKEYDNALKYANDSIALQNEIGYKSGVLFGYFALCYCYYCLDNRTEYDNTLSKMRELQSKINTYSYLVKFVEYLYSKDWDNGDYQWLDEDEMFNRVKELL